MAKVADLVVKARLDNAGITRGVRDAVRELERLQKLGAQQVSTVTRIDPVSIRSLQDYKRQNEEAAAAVKQRAAAEQAAVVAEREAAAAINELQAATAKLKENAAAAAINELKAATQQVTVAVNERRAAEEAANAVAAKTAAIAAQEAAAVRQLATAEKEAAVATNQQVRATISLREQFALQDQAMRRFHGVTDQVINKQRELAGAQAATGRQSAAAASQINNSFVATERAVRGTGLTINSLRGPLATISSQVLATNPSLVQFSSILGTLAFGSGPMIAVLAGLAALAAAYERITRTAREATQAQRDVQQSASQRLQALIDQQQALEAGPGGQTVLDVADITAEIEQLRQVIGELQNASLAPNLVDRLQDRLSELIGQRLAGLAEIRRAEREAADEALRALEEQGRAIERLGEARQRVNALIRESELTAAFQVTGLDDLPAGIREAFQEAEGLRSKVEAVREAMQELADAGGGVSPQLAQFFEDLQQAALETEAELRATTANILDQFNNLANLIPAPTRMREPIRIPVVVDPLSLESLERTFELVRGRIALDFARGLIDQRQMESEGREAAQRFNRALLAEIERLRAAGKLVEALELAINLKTDDTVDTSGLDDTIDAVQQVTSGFEAMAGALGETSRELSAVFRGIDLFTGGLKLIETAQRDLTGALTTAGALSTASGVLSIGAAVLGVAKSILDGADAAREAERQFARSMEDWERAIRGGGDAIERAFIDARNTFEGATGLTTPADVGDAGEFNRRIQEFLRDFGDQIKPEKLAQINQALDLFNRQVEASISAIRLFEDSLRGAADKRDIENRLRGVELDPTQVVSGLLNDLLDTFPELFKKIFGSVDAAALGISDLPDIRQAALDFFLSIKDLSGAALTAVLGDVSSDDFLAWLRTLADSFDTLDKATRDVASSLRNVPEVFNFTLASIRAAGPREFVPPPPTTFEPPDRNRGRIPPSADPARTAADAAAAAAKAAVEAATIAATEAAIAAVAKAREGQEVQQDNSVNVGDLIVNLSASTGHLAEDIAAALLAVMPQLLARNGKMTAAELVALIKPELVRLAPSKGQDTKELARAWPG